MKRKMDYRLVRYCMKIKEKKWIKLLQYSKECEDNRKWIRLVRYCMKVKDRKWFKLPQYSKESSMKIPDRKWIRLVRYCMKVKDKMD